EEPLHRFEDASFDRNAFAAPVRAQARLDRGEEAHFAELYHRQNPAPQQKVDVVGIAPVAHQLAELRLALGELEDVLDAPARLVEIEKLLGAGGSLIEVGHQQGPVL